MEDLESFVVESGEYTRTVWVIPGPPEPHPLYLFLDGEHYLRDMFIAPVARGLTACGRVPSGTWAFVSHVCGADRIADYTCNERYTSFIAEDVVSALRSRFSLAPFGHVIGGLSLSALAAAHLTLRYPGLFNSALCQSGSFWWRAEFREAMGVCTIAATLMRVQVKGEKESDLLRIRAGHLLRE